MITPLHVRSAYSLLAGTALPRRLVSLAAGMGHRRLAMTDVNALYGAVLFYKDAVAAGVRPILGAELTDGPCSAVALVENDQGYENLCRLITRRHCGTGGIPATPEGRRPAKAATPTTFALVTDLSELSAGLHVIVEDATLARALYAAGAAVNVGIDPLTQPHAKLRGLTQCAAELHLPLVATGKAMLPEAKDADLARLLAAIRSGTTYDTVLPSLLPPARAVLRSGEDLAAQLADFPEAADNNRRIAEACSAYAFLPRRPVFPDFPCPGGGTAAAYLRHLCDQGLRRRYGDIPSMAAESRLDRELTLIGRMGFNEYFLVVWDIVQYARGHGAPVAGRGSGASSIVAYCLGITNVCPLRYDIPFERFLHEGREDFPDLDVDFCWRIRDEVIDYAFKRWGHDHVAMVSMHGTFQERSAVREAAKAMGLSNDQVTRLDNVDLAGPSVAGRGPMGAIFGFAKRLLHLPHNLSVHPGGIVIGRKPIDHYAPIQPAAKGVTITQYDKNGVEDVRLVKLDLLGNRNLSTIRAACDLIRTRRGLDMDAESIPTDDEATLSVLQEADTVGCNQLESPAMRHLMRMMQPHSAGDVMKILALIRPGAASIGMKEAFIRRRRGLEAVPQGSPRVDALLRETYGVMLYEDDVMLVAAALLGGSLRQGDRFRKAVQKCRDDEQRLALSRDFLARCGENDVDLDYAKGLWVQMAKFNAYSFCRAHAASYAILAYAGAYLRTHFPLEFWAGALNNNQSMYHPRVYVEQAKRDGVQFLLPDANRSAAEFALEGDRIRVGFNFVAGLGPAAAGQILDQRQRRPFEGLTDFVLRTGVCEDACRSLVLCGAFDWTGRSRPTLMMELNLLARVGRRWRDEPPSLLPAAPVIPNVPGDYAPRRKYLDERRILGVSVGEHVLRHYRPLLQRLTDADSRCVPSRVGQAVRMAGVLEARRTTPTDRGGQVMFLTLDDEWGLFEATLFPDLLGRLGISFARYGPYLIRGKLEDQYGAITLIADDVRPIGEESPAEEGVA